ncbi:hypothetical protein B0H17DRAFT_1242216 [Mycena rosella]|uniref:Uncharacterized protein n=1 Tax=Mycena rosella TaxID=1033263 RepID=A0AAD7GQP6_MYCRO|nr:hypothetical protein B0H17DRAFT_1242216 [Mycena rosella]
MSTTGPLNLSSLRLVKDDPINTLPLKLETISIPGPTVADVAWLGTTPSINVMLKLGQMRLPLVADDGLAPRTPQQVSLLLDYVARSVASKVLRSPSVLARKSAASSSPSSALSSPTFGSSSPSLDKSLYTFVLSSLRPTSAATLSEPATPSRLSQDDDEIQMLVINELKRMVLAVPPIDDDEEPRSRLSVLEEVRRLEEIEQKGKGKEEMPVVLEDIDVGFV